MYWKRGGGEVWGGGLGVGRTPPPPMVPSEMGKSDFRCRGGGGVRGAPRLEPPPPKGSRDGTVQTNPGTFHVRMKVGGRWGLSQGAEWGKRGGRGCRGLEGEGGTCCGESTCRSNPNPNPNPNLKVN